MTGLILMLLTAPSHTDAPIPVNPRLPATIATRPLPVPPVCGMDAGSALGWDGGQFYCTPIATSAASWHVAYDCDFAALSAAPLDAGDGLYSICSVNWTGRNTATATVNRPALVPGSGIVMQPTQTPDIWNSTMDAPMFTVPLTGLYPSLAYETPIRLTLYATGNFTANYDQANLGVWARGAPTNYSWLKVGTGAPIFGSNYTVSVANGNQGTVGFQRANAPNVIQLTFPAGLAGAVAGGSAGITTDAGWPTMKPVGQLSVNDLPYNATSGPKPFGVDDGGMDSFEVFLAVLRAGSVTVLTGQVRHFLFEVYY